METSSVKPRWKKWMSILGQFLILFPVGIFWYWGNLLTYVTSYFLIRVQSRTGLGESWFLSFVICTRIIGTFFSELAERYIGRRKLILLGIIFYNLAIFSSYFTVHISMNILNVTMGGVLGIGLGILEAVVMKVVADWATDDTASLTILVFSALPIGAAITNMAVTHYVNPNNLPADFQLHKVKYFSQGEILDRVPNMFLSLGIASLSLQMIGLLLIRKSIPTSSNIDPNSTAPSINNYQTIHGIEEQREGNMITDDNKIDNCVQREITRDNAVQGKTIHEMLRSGSFYAVWLSYFLSDVPLILIFNYYKVYGQHYIEDDHFISTTAMTASVVSIVFMLVWGFVLDKIHVKTGLIILFASFVVLDLVFYFAPMTSKWFYFLVTLTLISVTTVHYATICVATVFYFGMESFYIKLGILTTAAGAIYLITPPILEALLVKLGWFSMFAWASICPALALIILIIFAPHQGV